MKLTHTQHFQVGRQETRRLIVERQDGKVAGASPLEAVPQDGRLEQREVGILVGGTVGAYSLITETLTPPMWRSGQQLTLSGQIVGIEQGES